MQIRKGSAAVVHVEFNWRRRHFPAGYFWPFQFDVGIDLVLSEQAALEIYRCKLQLQAEHENLPHRAARSALRGQSLRISYMPTTVRDIWNHRTWQRVTRHLWEASDVRNQDRRNRQRNGIGLEVDSLIPNFGL